MFRRIVVGIAFLLPLISNAVDQVTLNVDTIRSDDWSLQGIQIGLLDLNKAKKTLTLTVEEMVLPEPLEDFSIRDVYCSDLMLNDNEIRCRKGIGLVKSKWLDASKVNLSFDITESKKSLKIDNIGFARGKLSINAVQRHENWKFNIKGQGVDVVKLAKHFPVAAVDVSGGRIDFDVNAEMDTLGLDKVDVNAAMSDVGVQTQDGRYACENLAVELTLQAYQSKRDWVFENTLHFSQGAVYVEPVYLELSDSPIAFKSQGVWDIGKEMLTLSQASYNQQGIGVLAGGLVLNGKQSIIVDHADLSLATKNLAALTTNYILPFFAETDFDGISFAGELDMRINFVQQALTQVQIGLSSVDINDEQGRFVFDSLAGNVNWTALEHNESQTQLSWDQIELFKIPIAASTLSMNTDAGSIELNQRAVIPVLGGEINVEHFSWVKQSDQEPDVHFAGSIDAVSLQQLSTTMAWPPLFGAITGTIPGVRYTQGRVYLEGALIAKIFDGEVHIKDLASKGLFRDFSQFNVDIELDNLDLKQITHTFDFGDIEGRLSGYVRDLYLENWQPVSFDAWLGTPDNDDSRHRISQQAVNKITSVGGSGAANILSRTFLRFFDDFAYDRLGIGCLMQQGICQMQGVGQAESGFYIVKGGGLPRIDIIGYNSRVDWKVLLSRLKRVTGSK